MSNDDLMVHVLLGIGMGACVAGVIVASVAWLVVGLVCIVLAFALRERRR